MYTRFKVFASYKNLQYLCDFIVNEYSVIDPTSNIAMQIISNNVKGDTQLGGSSAMALP